MLRYGKEGNMKKTLFIFMLFGLFTFLTPVVKAEVILTDKEKNFVKEVYSEEYLNDMTEEQKLRVREWDLDNKEVETNSIEEKEKVLTRGDYFASSAKSVSITKACNTDACSIVVIAKWNGSPSVRSYDVMGARFTGTITPYQYKNGVTYIETDDVNSTCVNYQNLSNGFGCSFKLSETAKSFYITQSFSVVGSGTIYASYQHAMTSTSLTISKQYTLAYAGFGKVFDFYGTARSVYDQMNGVDITI